MNISKKLEAFLFMLPAIWLFTGMYTHKGSAKVLIIIILIFLLFSIIRISFKTIAAQFLKRKITWLLWTASIYALLSKEIHGYDNNEIRLLLSLAIYTTLVPEHILKKLKDNLNILVIFSCIISFSFAIYQTYILGYGRSWDINPIPYATFSAAAAISALYFLIHNHNIKYKYLNAIALSLALTSTLMSQTRGALLALFVSFIILFIFSNLKKGHNKYILLIVFLTVSTATVFNANKIQLRIEQTKKEIISIKNNNMNTSIGYRLQIWQAGYELAKSPSLLGLGENYISANKELYKQGKVTKGAVYWDHYHNQYINSLVKYGIIGFSIFIIFLVFPVIYFIKNKEGVSILGVSLAALYSVSSLTDIPFNQPISLSYYLIIIIITSHDKRKNV